MIFKSKKAAPAAAEEIADEAEQGTAAEPYAVFNTEEDSDAAPEGAAAPQKEEDETARLIALWQRDAAMLKLIVPEFDLEKALKNETFRSALKNGKTVFEAFVEAGKPQQMQEREEIAQNAQSRSKGTGEMIANPARKSASEFKSYIESIRNS